MEQKEMKIDLSAVARQAMQERQPGEDLDEALLRSCKKLYGESGTTAFLAVQNALRAVADRNKVDPEKALQQIMDGKSSVSVVTRTEVTQKTSTGSLDDVPPEIRAEVEKALASGKNRNVVITRRIGGQREGVTSILDSQKQASTYSCQNCGYEFSSDLLACPQCGKPKKRSFWSRLFGG